MATIQERYNQIKEQYPDTILLFSVGDFYEVYHEDAKKASKTLSVTLTHRGDGTPLCGFPFHALDSYLPKLVRAGYRVAICDPLEESKVATHPKRGITELVSPSLTEQKKQPLPAGLTQQTATQLSLFEAQPSEYLLHFRDEVAKELLVHRTDLMPNEAAFSANNLVECLYGINLALK